MKHSLQTSRRDDLLLDGGRTRAGYFGLVNARSTPTWRCPNSWGGVVVVPADRRLGEITTGYRQIGINSGDWAVVSGIISYSFTVPSLDKLKVSGGTRWEVTPQENVNGLPGAKAYSISTVPGDMAGTAVPGCSAQGSGLFRFSTASWVTNRTLVPCVLPDNTSITYYLNMRGEPADSDWGSLGVIEVR